MYRAYVYVSLAMKLKHAESKFFEKLEFNPTRELLPLQYYGTTVVLYLFWYYQIRHMVNLVSEL